MKAAALTGIRQIEIIDLPEPRLSSEHDVLLQVELVGICGSDVHYYETGRIGEEAVRYPFVLGHECAATVVDVGKAVKGVKAGDRVAVEPAIACGDCQQCRAGRENTCSNLRFLGCPGQMQGCLREYIVMPERCCFRVDESVGFAEAVLCEPLAIALYAVRQAQMPAGADVAILGAGPIGLSCLLAARVGRAGSFYVTEKVAERVNVAARAGATWVGNPDSEDVVAEILQRRPDGVDVAFECAGQQETIDQAVDVLKPGGKIMLIGIPRIDRVSFVIEKIRRKEITIVNVRRQNQCTQLAVDAVRTGRIVPGFMATHRFGLEQVQQAFDMVAGYRDGVVKAMVQVQSR